MNAEKTYLDNQIEDLKEAGYPVKKGVRPYYSSKLDDHNLGVYAHWFPRWARNMVVNYPVIRQAAGVRLIQDGAAGLPVVVAGIGPSLDNDLPLLRKARSNFVLIATDAAFRPMAAAGITPDLVINFDARDEQATMWETAETSGAVLVANSCTSPLTLAAWKGRMLFFNMENFEDEFCANVLPAVYPDLGAIPTLATVGNAGVALAYQLGAERIITVGMDLCYKPYGAAVNPETGEVALTNFRYRCNDFRWEGPSDSFPSGRWAETENKALYDNAERLKNARSVEYEGLNFVTDDELARYRDVLLRFVTDLKLPITDCSDGALSGSVERMTLDEAIRAHAHHRIMPGRTLLRHHLPALLGDCKAGLVFDGSEWGSK